MFELLSNYALFSLSTVMAFAALATLLHLQFGLTGIVNFGVVGFWGLGMYAFGILLIQYEVPYPLAMVLAVAIVAVVSLFIGWVIADLSDQAVLVATLAFGTIVADLVTTEKWLTKGVVGLGTVPHPIQAGESSLWLFLILTALTIAIVLYSALIARTPYGRLLAASRDNDPLARGLGKNTSREKLTFFVITCALMGLVGVLSAPVHRFLTPDLIGPGVTFSAWIALIVGGKRHPLGGVLGVALTIFVFDFVIETYVPIPSEHAATVTVIKTIIYGVTLIAVLMFRPLGLLGARRKTTL